MTTETGWESFLATSHTMAQESRAVHFLEEQEIDTLIPITTAWLSEITSVFKSIVRDNFCVQFKYPRWLHHLCPFHVFLQKAFVLNRYSNSPGSAISPSGASDVFENHSIPAYLDSGAAANFIQQALADCLHLPTTPLAKPLAVASVNGQPLSAPMLSVTKPLKFQLRLPPNLKIPNSFHVFLQKDFVLNRYSNSPGSAISPSGATEVFEVNEAIPFSTEETSCVNDGASGILPGESLDEQLAILESLSLNANSSTTTDNTGLKVIVKYGNIELQKADVLAVPLLATNPVLTALNVTKSLKLTAGDRFSNLFRTVLQSQTPKAGCCIELPTAGGSYSVDSKCVIFIICSKWKNEDNSPEMELRDGIRQLLNKCNSMREVISVAVSAIGTGKALNFSNALAATIMGEEIKRFVDTHPKTNIKEIQIVIKQLQTVYIAYREIFLAMDLGQRIKLCNENGDHFINIAYGEHTQIKKGRLTVSVVYGDIVMESTKAIVNPTDFISWGAHTCCTADSRTPSSVIQDCCSAS
ncbi:uncharacterized protein LOC142743175 [Rhinoderma darwinii]|uniref:uncharacterized protein LOC142743175 n=1 Tax=Rhinoderma darwinii TaxID=43563 RepID=UPI003F66A7A6